MLKRNNIISFVLKVSTWELKQSYCLCLFLQVSSILQSPTRPLNHPRTSWLRWNYKSSCHAKFESYQNSRFCFMCSSIIACIPSVVLLLVNFNYIEAKCSFKEITFGVWPWVEAIAFISSEINPLIYYLRNGDFHWAAFAAPSIDLDMPN